MTAASDSGASSSDAVSNNSTPSFAIGAPPAGATPILFVDGVEVAATFDANTNTLTPTTPLSDGSHTITVALRNSAGTSAQSPGLPVSIDTAAPATPATPDMTAASDSGINPDDLTNDTTPSFTIAAPGVGETAGLYVDGAKVAATFDGVTNTLTPTVALDDGAHNISHTFTDTAGNESAQSVALAIDIDITAPAAPATPDMTAATDSGVNTDNLTNDSTPSFTIAAPAAGETASLYVDGVKVAAAFDGLTNTLTPTAALSEGAHNISHTIADAAGNESNQSVPLPIVIDSIAASVPSISAVVENSSGGINAAEDDDGTTINIAIPADASVGDVLAVNVGGQVVNYTVTEPDIGATANVAILTATLDLLSDGNASVTATITDQAGNVSSASAPFGITLDRVAPGKPVTADLSALTDTGQSSIDNVTGNNRPSLEIAVPAAGETPALYVDGIKVPAALSQNPFIATIYYLTPISPIANGVHNITYTMSDAAGNESPASDPLSITVDAAAPATPVAPDLATSSDSGIIDSDNYTNEDRPEFAMPAGTGSAGDRVRLYVDGVVYQTGTVAGDGSFTLSPTTSLPDGVHSVTYSFIDAAGNESVQSPELNVTIDTTPAAAPTITAVLENSGGGIDSAEDNDGTTVSVSIPASAGVGDLLTLKIGTTAPDVVHTIAGGQPGTNISIAVPAASLTALGLGAHDITATIIDLAGNVSAPSVPFTITLIGAATTAPTIVDVPENADGGINATEKNSGGGIAVNVDITGAQSGAGAVAAGDSLRFRIDGGAGVDIGIPGGATSGTVTVTIPTASLPGDGSHTLTVAIISGGLEGPISPNYTLTFDTVEPAPVTALDMTSTTDTGVLATDNNTGNARPTFVGAGVAGNTVTILVDGIGAGTATVLADNSFVVTPTSPIANGTHTATYTFTDAAGNVSGASGSALSFTIDTTQPGTPAAAPNMTAATDSGSSNIDNYTGIAQPVFNIAAAGSNTVKFYVDGVAVPFSPIGGNNYRLTSPVPDGIHSVTYTLTDDAGNESNPSPGLSFIVDTTPVSIPSITSIPENSSGGINGVEDDDGTTVNVAIPGNASVGDVLNLNVGGQPVNYNVTAPDIDGSASVTILKATLDLLSDATHSVTATLTDQAGNVSAASAPFSVTLNRAATILVASPQSLFILASEADEPGDTLQLSEIIGPSAIETSVDAVDAASHQNVAGNSVSIMLQDLIDSANTPS